jgi:hypothetical protein
MAASRPVECRVGGGRQHDHLHQHSGRNHVHAFAAILADPLHQFAAGRTLPLALGQIDEHLLTRQMVGQFVPTVAATAATIRNLFLLRLVERWRVRRGFCIRFVEQSFLSRRFDEPLATATKAKSLEQFQLHFEPVEFLTLLFAHGCRLGQHMLDMHEFATCGDQLTLTSGQIVGQ